MSGYSHDPHDQSRDDAARAAAPPQRPPVAIGLTPQMIPSKESSSGFVIGLIPHPSRDQSPDQSATIATLRADNEAKTAEIARLTAENETIALSTDGRYPNAVHRIRELSVSLAAVESRATRAEAALARAVEALEPFAKRGNAIHSDWLDHEHHWNQAPLTVGDLRRATSTLAAIKGETT